MDKETVLFTEFNCIQGQEVLLFDISTRLCDARRGIAGHIFTLIHME